MNGLRIGFLQLVVAVFVSVLLGRQCQATLLAGESYDYETGSGIIGEMGGSGWADAWSGSTPSATGGMREIQTPGTTYPMLGTTGNKAFIAATNQTQRTLLDGVLGTTEETIWLSFISQRIGNESTRFFGVTFYQGTSESANEHLTIGENSDNPNDTWGAHFTSSSDGRIEVAGASVFTESLLLARIDYHGDTSVNDDFYMWVNPDLSQGEPDVATAGASSIGSFNLSFDIVSTRAGTFRTSDSTFGQAIFDEIRIGDTFADVTPSTAAGIPGDFNSSGAVENADLTLLLNNWAQTVPPVPNGWIGTPQPTAPAIDNDELTALLNNWGQTSGRGSNSTGSVPEPATICSFGFCMLAIAWRRRVSAN